MRGLRAAWFTRPHGPFHHGLLGETIGDKSLRSQATRLGRALLTVRDRQFGDLRVELVTRSHNTTRWRVVEVLRGT